MNIGFIIICRYNSTRLPGKILKNINGKTVLQYIIERLNQIVTLNKIVVATSDQATDNPIAEYCIKNKINIYRGSLNNVAQRFLNCGVKYNFDYIARINGDNLFVDIETANQMKSVAETGKYDFISNVKNRTFPKGMSIEIVKTDYFKELYKQFNKEEYFEHVTLYLYEKSDSINHFYFYNKQIPEIAGIQLAIDTENDFNLAQKIINEFKTDHTNYGLREIFRIIKKLGYEKK